MRNRSIQEISDPSKIELLPTEVVSQKDIETEETVIYERPQTALNYTEKKHKSVSKIASHGKFQSLKSSMRQPFDFQKQNPNPSSSYADSTIVSTKNL